MELILFLLAGTAILFIMQLMEFVHRGRDSRPESGCRTAPRPPRERESLTVTVPVASAYAR
jgi:hypothetical protein